MNIIGMESATTFYPSTGCASHQMVTAKDEIVSDRIIATSTKTAPDVLEALSRTASLTILELIASNSNCPASLLKRLTKHSSAQVRLAAAENSNTNIETLWHLINDEDSDVRFGLAEKSPHARTDTESIVRRRQSLCSVPCSKNSRTHRSESLGGSGIKILEAVSRL